MDISKAFSMEPGYYNGQPLPVGSPMIPKERFEELSSFKGRKDDVYVASYPKSGTHWVSDIATKVAFEGDLDKAKAQARPSLEMAPPPGTMDTELHNPIVSLSEMADSESPRVFGTHLWYENLPVDIREKNCKIIYVWRDWKDCTVSKYNMMKRMLPAGGIPPWDAYFSKELLPTVFHGSWPAHIKNYQKHAARDNVLVLRYEEMKQDLLKAVKAVAKFLEKELSEDCLQKIADSCTFEATKKVDPNSVFLNKGVTGEWSKYFSEEQAKRMDDEIEKAGLKEVIFD